MPPLVSPQIEDYLPVTLANRSVLYNTATHSPAARVNFSKKGNCMTACICEMQTYEVFFSNRLRAVSYFSLQSYSTRNPPECCS